MRIISLVLLVLVLGTPSFSAPGNTAAGLAGVGAGAALGGAGQAGATTPAGAGAAGGAGAGATSSAPIEVQIMAYRGLSEIASDIATVTESKLCGARAPEAPSVPACKAGEQAMLLEDPTSALQIALYQSLLGYHDQLRVLHSQLTNTFSLIVKPQVLKISSEPERRFASLTLSAADQTILRNVKISVEGPDQADFTAIPDDCAELSALTPCTVIVTFHPPEDAAPNHLYSADLRISMESYVWNQSVTISATYTPSQFHRIEPSGALAFTTGDTGAPATPAASPAGGAAAASPLSLTYLSGIGTALAGLKSGISYSSSTAQPTTQSLEVLLENELKHRNIEPYTSTSALDLSEAAKELSAIFGDMLLWGAQIDHWNTVCKPPVAPTPAGDKDSDDKKAPADKNNKKDQKDKVPLNPECSSPVVTTNLAAATQLITGYTTLLQNSSDGNGNPVIADVLRGQVLAKKLKTGMKSLQVNVAAAAGSTRTNAFFFVNIFYLPKPSYNAGVIVTFELRDQNNDLLQAGARTAFYDYNKNWKGTNFDAAVIKDSKACKEADTFCVEQK
jgi:hypothetical protein